MILSIGASLSGALRTEHYETSAIPSIVRAKWPLFEKGTVTTQRFKLLPPRGVPTDTQESVALAKA